MDNLILAPIKTQKAYILIVETFINLIAEGKLEYGHRLYNEAELMTVLNVSRATLREALRVMEFLDIVSVSPRKGIRINNPAQTNGYPPLIYLLMFEKVSSVELFEVRRALQVEFAGDAAARRTEENLNGLREINHRMIAASHEDYLIFSKHDYDFHMQITRCSENRLGIKLMQTLGVMLEAQLRAAVRDFPVENREIIISFHTKILKAIEEQDEKMACSLMTEHLEKPYRSAKNANTTYCLARSSYEQIEL